MKISLIIAYCKNVGALSIIFKALEKQSEKDFEVIVADDDVRLNFALIDEKKRAKDIFCKNGLRKSNAI